MKRFFSLKFGEKFEVNGVVYQKENFFCAVRSSGTREFSWPPSAPLYRDFWPWTRVSPVSTPFEKILRREAARLEKALVAEFSKPSPFLDLITGGTFPKGQRIRALMDEFTATKPYTREQLMTTPYTGPYSSPPRLGDRKHRDDERTGPAC